MLRLYVYIFDWATPLDGIALMMTQDWMGNVRCFQFGNLLIGKLEVEGGNRILKMMWFGCSDDGSGDSRFVQQPGQGHLRGRYSASRSQLFYAIHHAVISFARVEFVGIVIRFGAQRAGLAISGKQSTRQRTPWDYSDAFCPAERNHFTFFFPVNKVVVVLHGDKTGEAVTFRRVKHLGKLPCVHGRGADVTCFPGFDHISQRVERFFNGSFVIEAMNLVEVIIIGPQAAQTGVNSMQDVLARKPFLIGAMTHGKESFGGDHQVLARGSEIFEGATQDFLTLTQRIHVSGIEKIDSQFERLLDE